MRPAGYGGSIALLAALGATALADPVPLPAQEAPAERLVLSRADSLEILRAARSDQSNFERFRRNRLPETWGGGSSRCDERIGRFCLNHTSGRDNWVAPPEDPEVVEARLNLVDGLGQVAALMPGDGWIAGQLVRYLLEAKRLDDALAAARACRAEPSWCSALEGFVLHYAARPAEADVAFDAALAAMEPAERQRWTDLSLILDDRSVRTYRRLRGEERAAFEERFWRLADPQLTRPGNELRSEHLSRHVWDQLQYRAQSTDGISWGYDLREIVIRYGWPTGWQQTRGWSSPLQTGPPPLVSHYSTSPQYLLPPPEALLGENATEGIWESDAPKARTGYNIPMEDSIARWFSPLSHQVAVFHRGDSAVVVAAYELPADSIAPSAVVEAGIAVLPTTDLEAQPELALREGGPSGTLTIATPARPILMSLELTVPSERRLARVRYGLDLAPPERDLLALSDLLLLQDRPELPESLDDAAGIARGSTRVRAGEPVGVYWEIYGVDPERTPELVLSLRLVQGSTSWLRRLAERTGIVREVAPIRLRWEEGVSTGPVLARSVNITIPSVSAGAYAIELSVQAPGREALTVRREVEVTGG